MTVFLGSEDPTQKGERTVDLVRFHSSVAMSKPVSQRKAMAASLTGSYRERWNTKKWREGGMGGLGGGIRGELTFT